MPDERDLSPPERASGGDESQGGPVASSSLRGELRRSARRAFDRSFWVFFILAAGSAAACWAAKGEDVFLATLVEDLRLLGEVLPRIMAALAVAALIQVLIPREVVAKALSEEAGAKGVALATAAGALTPGGPMTSFPLVSALHTAGSGRPALVAYLTSWSTLGFQRILSWEVPLMGLEFALVRFIASLPLPFVAAAVSTFLPRARRKTES